MHSEWLLFEAAALSKAVHQARICTLLVDLTASDVRDPLAQFQSTTTTKDDILKLVKSLNELLESEALPDAQVEQLFDILWPKLEENLKNLPPEQVLLPPPEVSVTCLRKSWLPSAAQGERIDPDDHEARRRLAGYMVHPPIALERLRYRPETGQVIYYFYGRRDSHQCPPNSS